MEQSPGRPAISPRLGLAENGAMQAKKTCCLRAGRDAERFRCFRCLDLSPLLQGRALSKKLATKNGLVWLVTDRQLKTLGQSGK